MECGKLLMIICQCQQEKKRKIGNSISKHANYFEYLLNNYSGMLLIVLDEIDKASDPQMINKIIRMESTLSKQFPCVIGITNDLFMFLVLFREFC